MATDLALAAGGAGPDPSPGLIAIFDLDQTIIGHVDPPYTAPALKAALNPRILDILIRLARARERYPRIDLLLLTNNSIRSFIKGVDSLLFELSGGLHGRTKTKTQFFDFIMDRLHTSRIQSLSGEKRPREENKVATDPPKTMNNVAYMINRLYTFSRPGHRASMLHPQRIFFFDDRADHVIAQELAAAGYPEHFIHIVPPFTPGKEDTTDLSVIEGVLTLYEPKPKTPETESEGETASLPGGEEVVSGKTSVAGSTNNSGSENEGRSGAQNPLAKVLANQFNAIGGRWKHKTSKGSKGKKKGKGKKGKGVKGKTAKKNLRSKYRK